MVDLYHLDLCDDCLVAAVEPKTKLSIMVSVKSCTRVRGITREDRCWRTRAMRRIITMNSSRSTRRVKGFLSGEIMQMLTTRFLEQFGVFM